MRKYVFLVLFALLSGALLSVVWATMTDGTVSITASSTTDWVSVWSSSSGHQTPSWTPTEGVTESIATKGGIATVAVPDGTGSWNISVYLRNPDDLMAAYSFLNMEMEVIAASTATDSNGNTVESKVRTNFGTNTTDPTWDMLTSEKGYVSLRVDAADGTLINGERVFFVGIRSGSYHAFETGTAANLSPSFYVEVRP